MIIPNSQPKPNRFFGIDIVMIKVYDKIIQTVENEVKKKEEKENESNDMQHVSHVRSWEMCRSIRPLSNMGV